MIHYLVELILWLLLAFFIGAIIACLLRRLFSGAEEDVAVTTTAATGAATATAASAVSAPLRDPEPAPAPEPEAEPEPDIPAFGLSKPLGGKPDDLQMISGIGPKINRQLHELGVYHFAQIASWTEEDIAKVTEQLKFKGRIEREEWVRQARLLASGRLEEFERDYGTGGLKDKKTGKTRSGARTRRS